MKNSTTMFMCIADVNDLLTKALREHVLRSDNYEVHEVSWDSRENTFRINLIPVESKVGEPSRV